MHGATLLDAADRVLRPCILWNDGRSEAECAEFERRVPELRAVAGNPAMPGFTAPKLLWVAHHEPDIFARVRTVLWPKDYLRLRLTGTRATDPSDAAGTLWLDVGARCWSDALLAAAGLTRANMPEVFEGSAATGLLLPAIAHAWGLPRTTIVAGGGGDNAAAAVGLGAVTPGDAFLSLGTSGVIFEVDAGFVPTGAGTVHAFCHCLPGRWHRMAVTLSAASCLAWLKEASGAPSEAALAAEAEIAGGSSELMFLPHLAGERTPYNNPNATGAFVGLTHRTGRGDLARAVMEGVALSLADADAALAGDAARHGPLTVTGGGASSGFWLQPDRGRTRPAPAVPDRCGSGGPAYGAARLARLAVTGETVAEVCTKLPIGRVVEPDPAGAARSAARLGRFRTLYRAVNA